MYKNIIITGFLLFSASGNNLINSKESNLLIGIIRNQTMEQELDSLGSALNRLLSEQKQFLKTFFDPDLLVESFPDESALVEARKMEIDYVIWGEIDSCNYGFSITLIVLSMSGGKTAHINVIAGRNDKETEIAEILRSKLLLWFNRTEMVQLIISTSPSSASILMDNNELGLTPYEGMVNPGTYSLKLIKKPYMPIEIPVSFISGNTYQYDFTLKASESNMDKRSVLKWLGLSLLLTAGGGTAHYFQQHAIEEYKKAKPGADFDHLYNKALVWTITRDILWVSAGFSFGLMIFKIVF